MKKFAFLLLALVLVAGCIGQRSVKIEANNGLKLEEFSADPRIAEYSDNVLFTVGVENVGGTTATKAMLRLFGLEKIWSTSPAGQQVSQNEATYKFGDESFEPPVPSQNRPGDLKIFAKTFWPPVLPEGVEQDFPVTARVMFDYSTTGSIIVPVISKSLLKIKTDKGEAVESASRITNSDGPLKIGLSKGTVPIVVDNTKSGEQEATFVVEFLNVGDGFPVSPSDTSGSDAVKELGRLQGSISVFGPGVRFDEKDGCLGFTSTTNKIDFTSIDPNKIDLMKLRSTGRLPLSCTIKIQRSAFTPTTSGIITFSVNMNYRYFIEKTLNVRVAGTKEVKPFEAVPTQATRPDSILVKGSAGFETRPSGKDRDWDAPDGDNIIWDKEYKHSGERSYKIYKGWTVNSRCYGLAQDAMHSISGRAQARNGKAIILYNLYHDPGCAQQSGGTIELASTTSASWDLIGGNVQTPPSANKDRYVYIRLFLTSDAGIAWFDDMEMYKVSGGTTTGLPEGEWGTSGQTCDAYCLSKGKNCRTVYNIAGTGTVGSPCSARPPDLSCSAAPSQQACCLCGDTAATGTAPATTLAEKKNTYLTLTVSNLNPKTDEQVEIKVTPTTNTLPGHSVILNIDGKRNCLQGAPAACSFKNNIVTVAVSTEVAAIIQDSAGKKIAEETMTIKGAFSSGD